MWCQTGASKVITALPLGEALVALWLLAVATSRVDAVTTTTTCEPPKLRLSGGASGRLEVRYCGVWGTVCDDSFGTADARVVCRELGYGNSVGTAISVSSGTGPIWLDDLGCSGTELRLADCSHSGWGQHNCGHNEDVGVNCNPTTTTTTTTCLPTQVRLSGGSAGRLEVRYCGVWGTVCDDYFGTADARVVCRELGYGNSVGVRISVSSGTGPIWLDNLGCSGTEMRLADCSHSGWGQHNCGHSEDVGVSCNPNPTTTTTTCLPTQVRLSGGSSGRLHVRYCGVWGTVCDDYFGTADASVVCRELGYGSNAGTVISVSSGTGPIWLDNLACRGTEARLSDCSHSGWGNHNCGHSEDVGVRCRATTTTTSCPPGRVRLSGGSSGRVEVLHCGVWGTVCDDSFSSTDARVVCRELGYGSSVGSVISVSRGTGPIWLDNLACRGTEWRLSDCSHNGWGRHNCDHSEDVGVSCRSSSASPTPSCPPPLIRLSGGSRGRLEVRYCGVWGTVCDDSFGSSDASVVCRELGYSTTGASVFSATPGTGQIWLDDLQCRGTESQLSDCLHRGWGSHDCNHNEDVGVSCEGSCYEGQLWLSEGNRGRLEVCHLGEWGTVCDDSFHEEDAGVVCRQMGYSGGTVLATVDPGHSAQIWLDDLSCSGSENRLVDCSHSGWGNHNCGHSEDVGVYCILEDDDDCRKMGVVPCKYFPVAVGCACGGGALLLLILVWKIRKCNQKSAGGVASGVAAQQQAVTPPNPADLTTVIGTVIVSEGPAGVPPAI